MRKKYDFAVQTLGECKIPSPVQLSKNDSDNIANYVSDDEHILYDIEVEPGDPSPNLNYGTIEKSGPREKIYFNPRHVHAGILTCGGLCPGLNDVIRALVRALWNRYGVRRITGIRYGYNGFLDKVPGESLVEIDPDLVDDIHRFGGSFLGSSRGGGEHTEEIVDSIERLNMNMVFIIGGDGTQKGALRIADEIEKRGLKIAIIGIPKTVDNDLSFIDKSFGFETAVGKATEAVTAAHQEANSAINGVGLVKVMGRESGFIGACTALASHDVNFVLIPEVPFEMEGDNGFLAHLRRRIQKRGHAVVVVAEGAGQNLFAHENLGTDESGNKRLGDIGVYLRNQIAADFKANGLPLNLKYIDPSYIIRSSVAAPADSLYCTRLATNAVHAAMAGKTKMLISELHNTFVHIPIEVAVSSRNTIDPESALWLDVIQAIGMPVQMTNDAIGKIGNNKGQ
jgi:6-phosphofructokinase 1